MLVVVGRRRIGRIEERGRAAMRTSIDDEGMPSQGSA
jgi:hypothetical protein